MVWYESDIMFGSKPYNYWEGCPMKGDQEKTEHYKGLDTHESTK